MDNLPLPSQFLVSPGSPALAWKIWIRSFQNYLTASGATGEGFSEERRIALLVHCLGAEGQRIYYSILPSEGPDTLAATIDLLQKHFAPQENVVAARYKFRMRAQLPGEHFDQWYSELKSLISSCNYRDLESEMLRDQIVEKTANNHVRERLLMESDLTLDRALTVAHQVEQAITDANAISRRDTESVNRVRRAHVPASGRKGACFCCGEEGHWAKDRRCPAREATCDTCGTLGHFAKVCKRDRDTQSADNTAVRSVSVYDIDDGIMIL